MQKRIFIHIGTHKTGSKSIQGFLAQQGERLRAAGIFASTVGAFSEKGGNHNVAWELGDKINFNPQWGGVDDLLNALSQSDLPTAVISSEDFEYLALVPDRMRSFDAQLTELGYDTHYLVYFRNFASYAKSLYLELNKKHGMADTEAQFMARLAQDRSITFRDNWYFDFDYERFVRNWTGMVGPRVAHFSYDEIAASEGIVPHFLRTIGCPDDIVALGRSAPVLNKTKRKWLRFWR